MTEKFVRLYATADGSVTTEIPAFSDTLAQEEVADEPAIERLTSMADELHKTAEMEALTQVEAFVEEARKERVREIDIKREHAKRYFAEQIGEWEERLETYQQRAGEGADMSAPIGNAKLKLESLRREHHEELTRLDEERHVTPEEPDLVTAAFIVPSAEGKN